uniref:Uncharacterized protein n=1 Tax=viral metagenome TaxID=1070528 RepID=A0A6C0JY83_9ZZZZ
MSTQAERFSSCVKKITKNWKASKLTKRNPAKKRYTKAEKERIAIAICTKSVLWPQGRTIRRFAMVGEKPVLITQKKKFVSKSR